MHLSKPHLDEDTLVVNVVNPTAGLLAGDRIRCEVQVESGARLLLTTPSASRAHRMKGGNAEISQEFTVAPGGFLDIWPELFIPQGGTRYRQQTTIRVQQGGELLFCELLTPGRVAFGEAFAYDSLSWETDLFLDETLLARERYFLAPDSFSVRAMQARFPTAYYASCFVVSPALSEGSPCWAEIHALHEPEAWIGCSRLAHKGGWTIKLLAANSILLRRKLGRIRSLIYSALGRREPGLRRVSGLI